MHAMPKGHRPWPGGDPAAAPQCGVGDRHGASSPIGGRRIPAAIPDSRAGVGIELAEDAAAFLSVPMAGGLAAGLGSPPLRVEGSRNVESALGRGSCQVNPARLALAPARPELARLAVPVDPAGALVPG
jgi:hypothetical protein